MFRINSTSLSNWISIFRKTTVVFDDNDMMMALCQSSPKTPCDNHNLNLTATPRRRRYQTKVPLSVITLAVLVLVLQFFILPGYVYRRSPSEIKLSKFHLDRLDAKLQKCAEYQTPAIQYPVTQAGSRTNSRWNPKSGQNETIILRNATLFDGEKFIGHPVDILFRTGVIESISESGKPSTVVGATAVDLDGRHVTPGLVDMHSHHLAIVWPSLSATTDVNEVHPLTGPLTPQLRIVDGIKAYDDAVRMIASGGITTSLILPGSANIMGGEGALVKNVLKSGENEEDVVEEILLEYGVRKEDRRRYMKIACGENPKRVYGHTRMGNAWIFRKQLERAKELKEKQDAWCLEAAVVRERGDAAAVSQFMSSRNEESATEFLEFDSTIAMLRGKIGINIHCYESEDFEDMIKHSKEFGFRIQAFHHALDAWEVPELIKSSGDLSRNITIATFSEFGFFKKEGYESNLWAGKILAEHGVPLAYKSDHSFGDTNAKYLLFQAATAHSFHLPEDLALQSVTSVPAHSLEIDHRVGYVRPGYDADLVAWDSHPLSLGATALQVYVDGKPTLDPKKVSDSFSGASLSLSEHTSHLPSMRKVLSPDNKAEMCEGIEKEGAKQIVKGITTSYLDEFTTSSGNYTLIIQNGKIICFDSENFCSTHSAGGTIVNLENGHISHGLTAVTESLGLTEISGEADAGDGLVGQEASSIDPKAVAYAKYGIHLEGKAFPRARIGGVTRAITTPMAYGFVDGVSVGIKTSGKKNILNGGIFQDDVALHFAVGTVSKATESVPTVSTGIQKLRELVSDNTGKDNIYGSVANGTFALVVHVENEYDILQLIKIKQNFPGLNLVLFGGSGAPLIADELAASKIPLVLTANRGEFDTFEKRNALTGPPLTKSPAAILSAAGVKFGLAIGGMIIMGGTPAQHDPCSVQAKMEIGDSHIHNLPLEAGWAAKYAGLSQKQALDLVSTNIEEILGLVKSKDLVVYEGDPLDFGASVVLAVDGDDGAVNMCWPESK